MLLACRSNAKMYMCCLQGETQPKVELQEIEGRYSRSVAAVCLSLVIRSATEIFFGGKFSCSVASAPPPPFLHTLLILCLPFSSTHSLPNFFMMLYVSLPDLTRPSLQPVGVSASRPSKLQSQMRLPFHEKSEREKLFVLLLSPFFFAVYPLVCGSVWIQV